MASTSPRAFDAAAALPPVQLVGPSERVKKTGGLGLEPLLGDPTAWDAEEDAYLTRLHALCPEIARAQELLCAFLRLLRERDGAALDPWLDAAADSGIPEVHGFATGVRRDDAAVAAALAMEWSNGQVEGQVNRLKLLKRQGYGRSGFALLRQRVLHRG